MSDEAKKTETPAPDRPAVSRRGFLFGAGSAAALAGLSSAGSFSLLTPAAAEAADISPGNPNQRRNAAWQIRKDAALFHKQEPLPNHPCNGDEALYGDLRGSFSKALPHNNLGEVDPNAYAALTAALSSGDSDDFDLIPLGGNGRLANPQAANAFSMTGADSHRLTMIAPPAFDSAWEASEMAEVYWHAVTRDVPFIDYASDPLTNQAAADLSSFSDFRGPKQGGQVTPATLFRGDAAGDLVGPYLSQLLWQPVPFGLNTIEQQYVFPVAGDDYMTTYSDWLAVQRGILPSSAINPLAFGRYMSNGRDLGEFVHRDWTYQAYLQACLILLGYGGAAFDQNNPYQSITNQGPFISFGASQILSLVAEASQEALKAAWYQKWLVHRRLRPEVFGGRIHNQLTGAKNYGINAEILNSPVLAQVFSQNGNYLLPMAYPEGSPTHPAYPAGHATIAGACTTVLKAFFDESFVFPNPVEADATGTNLLPWTGTDLTIGGELDKLAANISLGRDIAGVHWRTDGTEGILLGEQVALNVLRDARRLYTEEGFDGWRLTTFDGTQITI